MGWKVFTHDRRSPIRGGAAAWPGGYPYELPKVSLDGSAAECGAGWHYCEDPAAALRIAGLWPNGRPSLLVLVEPVGKVVARGDKSRAARLRLVREATADELRAAVGAFSAPFAPHVDEMVREQLLWREALGRPARDAAGIEAGPHAALRARGLEWKLSQCGTAAAARDAWDAWDAWAAWDARAAWAAWDARAAWAAWAAWAARAAWAAWAALTLRFAARQGWVSYDADLLTIGVRDAYLAGLEIAIPTGTNTLGYVTAEGGATSTPPTCGT